MPETFEDAEYQGRKVTLNKPFRNSDGPGKFSVYVRNDKGNVIKVNFGSEEMEIKRDDPDARASFRARHKCDTQKDKATAAYWSCRMWQAGKSVSEILDCQFTDSMTYDADTKTAVSVRDGVLEYLGSEIGMEPAEKLFRVFRSPSTIANVVPMMRDLPLTDEHVPLDVRPAAPVGSVLDATTVDLTDESTGARLGIRNRIKLSDAIAAALVSGKRELSLGYTGELVPYTGPGDYDFEQRNIRPHHLAVVSAGRCGPACSFIDRKATTKEVKTMPELHKAFCDAEGQMNLEQIIEIAAGLPEALKKMPIEKVQEIMPALQEAVMAARAETGEAMSDEDTETVEVEDEEMEKADMKPEEKFTDSKEFADAVAKAQSDAIAQRDAVVSKAVQFIDGLQVTGKTNDQVMREVLAAEGHDAQSFSDAELSVAFKLLKPEAKTNPALMNFGDQKTTGKFAALAEKES